MKYKKSIYLILVMIFAITFENSNVYAALGAPGPTAENVQQATSEKKGNNCYYISTNTKEDLYIKIIIWQTSNHNDTCGHDYCAYPTLEKYGKSYTSKSVTMSNYNFDGKYEGNKIVQYIKNGDKCPKYAYSIQGDNYRIYVTDSLSDVEKISKIAKDKKIYLATAYNLDESPVTPVTEEQYNDKFKNTTIEWDETKVGCNDLFGPKKGEAGYENGLRSSVDEILGYVRIIVPILIILLGTIDLAKAVIASKEDEMKKAQYMFIKRLIIGLAVFFVPVFVNIIMDLAEIVWAGDYTRCNL